MSAFVHLGRDPIRGAAADRSAATRAGLAQRTPHPADAAQQALGTALNRSPTIQAQLRLGHMLNQGPRMAAQMRLAQSLARRTAATPVATAQRRETNEDEQATQMRRERAATARFAPQAYRPTNLRVVQAPAPRQAPVQLALGDWVSSSRLIGTAIGLATGAYLGGSSTLGLVAGGLGGLALGAPAAAAASGLLLGGYLGGAAGSYLGSAAAPYLGGAASYLGSAAATVIGGAGSILGGVLGERAGIQIGQTLPRESAVTDEKLPDIGRIIGERAQEQGMSNEDANALANDPRVRPQIAAINQYAADTAHNAELTQILKQNAFIQRVLSGEVKRSLGGRKDSALPRGNLALDPAVDRAAVPPALDEALELFNELVTRDMGPNPIKEVKKNKFFDPISSTGDAVINVGGPAPRGILLHELGHHLEHTLKPEEIGSLHNFLRARSVSKNLRRVGYERLAGLRGEELGYDTQGPDLTRGTASWLMLSTLPFLAGLKPGSGVDEFFRGRSSDPVSSYSTQVYEGTAGIDTEYLSTTIHYFDDPARAEELVEKDPLRVCLFLSMARPDDYKSVQVQFNSLDGVVGTLDQRIHKISIGKTSARKSI